MPPVRPDNPDSRPAGAPGGDPRQESAPARAPEEQPAPPTIAPPTTTPPANALFRTLLKGAGDAETAYTATQEIQSMAGQNVTAELVARMDVLQGRTDKATTELGARFEAALKAAVTEFRTDLNSAVTELRTDLNSAVREVRSDLKTADPGGQDRLEGGDRRPSGLAREADPPYLGLPDAAGGDAYRRPRPTLRRLTATAPDRDRSPPAGIARAAGGTARRPPEARTPTRSSTTFPHPPPDAGRNGPGFRLYP